MVDERTDKIRTTLIFPIDHCPSTIAHPLDKASGERWEADGLPRQNPLPGPDRPGPSGNFEHFWNRNLPGALNIGETDRTGDLIRWP